MRTITYFILFILSTSFATLISVDTNKVIVINPKSELDIVGSSNVNNFKCLFKIENLNKPLSISYRESKHSIHFKKATLVLENTFFDCGGKAINKDFHQLLKTDKNPQILLTLKEIKKKQHAQNTVEALVQIHIAGQTKDYIIETQINQNEDLFIKGRLKLNIKDFDLKAPKKMLGLVVVSDEIEIIFNLIIEDQKSKFRLN